MASLRHSVLWSHCETRDAIEESRLSAPSVERRWGDNVRTWTRHSLQWRMNPLRLAPKWRSHINVVVRSSARHYSSIVRVAVPYVHNHYKVRWKVRDVIAYRPTPIGLHLFMCFYLPVSLLAIRLLCFNKLELSRVFPIGYCCCCCCCCYYYYHR